MQEKSPWDDIRARWAYRYQRFMLTPLFRVTAYVVVPIFAALTVFSIWITQPDRKAAISTKYTEFVEAIKARPEFQVTSVVVEGAEGQTLLEVQDTVKVTFPVSSFDVDADALRASILELSAVEEASVRVVAGGILEVSVDERKPVAYWVTYDGTFSLDAEGVLIREVFETDSGLPIIAGMGAPKVVGEALEIIKSGQGISDPIRGLERVGLRRWDIVLESALRIQLPEQDPVAAVDAVAEQMEISQLVDMGVEVVDMRIARRPTIRLAETSEEAEQEDI